MSHDDHYLRLVDHQRNLLNKSVPRGHLKASRKHPFTFPVATALGDSLEALSQQSNGLHMQLSGAALQYLMFGHRVCLMELCSGSLFIGVGMQHLDSVKGQGWAHVFPLG